MKKLLIFLLFSFCYLFAQTAENAIEPSPDVQGADISFDEMESLFLMGVEPDDSVVLDTTAFNPLALDSIGQSIGEAEQQEVAEPKVKSDKKKYGFRNYTLFAENPATLADRNFFYIQVPLTFSIYYRTSSLSWNSFVSMIEKGHVITDEEKEEFLGEDLNIDLRMEKDIFGLGYKNFDLSSKLLLSADVKDIGTEWLKLVFEGNGDDKKLVFEGKSGEGSRVISFAKTQFTYAHKKPFTLAGYPITLGGKINFYTGLGYAEVEKSNQDVNLDSGDVDIEVEYFRSNFEDNFTVGNSVGFGLGATVRNLPPLLFLTEGKFMFAADDLFAKVGFENVERSLYHQRITDYLDDDNKVDTVLLDTTFGATKKEITLKPDISLGVKYNVFRNFDAGLKFRTSEFAYDNGVSLGLNYYPLKRLPLNFTLGYDKELYYIFETGLDWYLDFSIKYVNYGAKMLGLAKGYYLKLDFVKLKF